MDNRSYLSACHAGCTGEEVVGNRTQYSNCTCIPAPQPLSPEQPFALPGPCPRDSCPNFPLFLIIFMTIVLFHSTSEVGSMLLTLRCVEPRDKAMALGLIQCAIGIFGNVPCPVIYGSLIDLACTTWGGGGNKCEDDGSGHCWIYDGDDFRIYFLGLTGSLMTIAFVIDLFVVYKAKEINFKEETVKNEEGIQLEGR